MNEQEFRKKVLEQRKDRLERVDGVAVVFRQGGRYLMAYNENWESLSFPSTKRRQFVFEGVFPKPLLEEVEVAAARAAFEVLLRSVDPDELGKPAFELEDVAQSLRDGEWKLYVFSVYVIDWPAGEIANPDAITEWMTKAEILRRLPVSPTARAIAERL